MERITAARDIHNILNPGTYGPYPLGQRVWDQFVDWVYYRKRVFFLPREGKLGEKIITIDVQ